MQTILCYGDSNTWGFVAGKINFETMYMERYPYHKRWTGILQNMLGANYQVVEEGLNGRTTNLDCEELYGRNGKTFLPVCLYTHAPLDLVIIMLGFNDLKQEFNNRSANEIAGGIKELLEIIKNSKYGRGMQSPPHVLLVSPPILSHEGYSGDMFKNAISRVKEFAPIFEKLAKEYQYEFVDAAPYVKISEVDGLHFDEKAHEDFAKLIYKKIAAI